MLVNRTFTPPPGLTGKKLEKELQRQADAFEQEVHSGISLDASMKLDDLIERWFTEYADRQLKPKTATEYRKLVPRVSAALGHMKVNQIRPAHLMAFYTNLSEDGVRQDSTYTATAALLKLLPKGQRARIREAAGVGEETMRGLCSGKPVSRKTAEKVADAAGLPLSKAFTEKVRAGGKLGGNTQPPKRQKSKWKHCRKRTLQSCWKPCRTRQHSTALSHSWPCSQVPAGARYAPCAGQTLILTRV